jgi:hypothetical protein
MAVFPVLSVGYRAFALQQVILCTAQYASCPFLASLAIGDVHVGSTPCHDNASIRQKWGCGEAPLCNYA